MQSEIRFVTEEPFDVVIQARGQADVDGFRQYLGELGADARWGPGLRILSDFSELDLATFSELEVRRVAELHEVLGDLEGTRCAVVAGSPANFGVVRMFGAYIDGRSGLLAHPFIARDEAMAWLSHVEEPA
jgi:hypothetical protein